MSKTTVIPTLTYRNRRSHADVPEDVEVALAHLNDPYYDFSDQSSRSSIDSLELAEKKYAPSEDFERSSHGAPSEFDSMSRTESNYQSKSQMKSVSDLDTEEDSPYAEVRSSVPNTDDPSMPVNTFRMWFLGIIFTIFISGMNQFFNMRYPSVFIPGLVAQLIALPAGKFLEWLLPTTRFRTFGYVWSLNPGPFNVKEHTLITVMANVVSGGAYATDVIAAQRHWFNQKTSIGYQLLLCLSSQLIGFGFAGFVRRVLVWPAAMVWPGVLVNAALFTALHQNYGVKERNHMSREKFFFIATVCSFVWYWFPGYIFTALSIFNWVCWIAPNNVVVNQLFGYSSGLGLGFLTFDWSMISYIGSPLVVPWWAEVNIIAGFVTFFWIICPILYYTNTWYAKFMPISGFSAFDNTGNRYDPSRIMLNGEFNVDMYKSYSPIYLPSTYALSTGLCFASITSVMVHTFLYYRHDISLQFRKSLSEQRDIHSRLMSIYPEVPAWWYGGLLVASFAMGIAAIETYNTELPVWGLLLAIIVSALFILPNGVIMALTNQTVALQVLGELIVGFINPGKPVAMMIFKTFSYVTMGQALSFAGDLKLGHYMKIPPRIMFLAQTVAMIVCVFVVVLTQSWMFTNIPDLCTPGQVHHFTCPGTSVFATSALMWGAIGPARLFTPGHIYYPLTYFFLIGALLPIPFYLLARRYPFSYWRLVNFPVMFAAITSMPPATGINFSSWFAFGALFQFFVRRYHYRWWMRYNYIFSSALTLGVAICLIIIFFTVQFPRGGFDLNWWGNEVWLNTGDSNSVPFYTLQPGQTFGPSTWD